MSASRTCMIQAAGLLQLAGCISNNAAARLVTVGSFQINAGLDRTNTVPVVKAVHAGSGTVTAEGGGAAE